MCVMDTVSSLSTLAMFWTLCIFLMIVDLTGQPRWMLRYKTQPGKNQPVEKGRLVNAILVALFNQLILTYPLSIALYRLKVHIGVSYSPEDVPNLFTILKHLAVCAVVQEIGFYYSHRLVHWGPLYKAIHKKHHEWTAPMGVIAVYAHPVEYIVSNFTPYVAGPLLMRSHVTTTWIWYMIAIITTVVHHSGYHLPFLPSSEFHDFHHLKFTCNYGVLGVLDWLHGTDAMFQGTVQCQRHRLLCSLTPVNETYPSVETDHNKQSSNGVHSKTT